MNWSKRVGQFFQRLWIAFFISAKDVLIAEFKVQLGTDNWNRLIAAVDSVKSMDKAERRAAVETKLQDLVSRFGEKFMRSAIEAALDQMEQT